MPVLLEILMRTSLFLVILVFSTQAQHLSRKPQLTTGDRIAATQKALAADPRNATLLEDLAGAYLQKMRETADFSYVDRAEKLVRQAIALKPSDLESQILLNEIELNRHHFAKVAESTGKLVRTAPDEARLWAMMGDALMETGNYDGAASAYEHMVKLRVGLTTDNRVSWYRWVTGDAEGAIRIMRQAVRSAGAVPENLAWCLVDLGNLSFKTGGFDEAESSFRSALQAFPGYHPAFAGLGRVQSAQGHIAEAIVSYRRAQEIVPLPEYAGALRELYLKQDNRGEARKQEELLDVVDRLASANFENTDRTLAVVFADQDRHLDRALELVENELAFRQDVYTYDAFAWVLFKNHRLPEAREAMHRALAQHTPEPMFQRHAAAILETGK